MLSRSEEPFEQSLNKGRASYRHLRYYVVLTSSLCSSMPDSVKLPTNQLYRDIFLRTLSHASSGGSDSGELLSRPGRYPSTQCHNLDDCLVRFGVKIESTCSITTSGNTHATAFGQAGLPASLELPQNRLLASIWLLSSEECCHAKL